MPPARLKKLTCLLAALLALAAVRGEASMQAHTGAVVFPPANCTSDAGNHAAIGWDGQNDASCMPVISRSGIGAVTIEAKVGIGTQDPGAPLEVVLPNSGVAQPLFNAVIAHVLDGNYRPAIEVLGGLSGSVYPDSVATVLRVGSVDGTGRSITTNGSIAAGQGAYFMGEVGVGTTSPDYLMHVVKNEDAETALVVQNLNGGVAAAANVYSLSDTVSTRMTSWPASAGGRGSS